MTFAFIEEWFLARRISARCREITSRIMARKNQQKQSISARCRKISSNIKARLHNYIKYRCKEVSNIIIARKKKPHVKTGGTEVVTPLSTAVSTTNQASSSSPELASATPGTVTQSKVTVLEDPPPVSSWWSFVVEEEKDHPVPYSRSERMSLSSFEVETALLSVVPY